MIDIMNKLIGFIVNNASNVISAGAMLIAAFSLWVTRLAFLESNRPYVTFNIEVELKPGLIFFYIRNTGIRGAKDVQIKISPTPQSYALASFPDHKDRDSFNFTFLAPNQTIRSVFDHGVHRYPKGQKPNIEVFDVAIEYKYKKKTYKDSYVCDTSYLAYIVDSSPSDEIAKGFEKVNVALKCISEVLTMPSDNV